MGSVVFCGPSSWEVMGKTEPQSMMVGGREGGRGGQEGQRVGGKPSQIVDGPVAQIRDDLLFHIHFLINFITKKKEKKRGLSVKF